MATLDWPTTRAFQARRCVIGARSPYSGFQGFFSGQTPSVSHAADRLRISIVMPPCSPADGAQREAFFMGMVSTGDLVRIGHLTRREPRGTMRGSPVTSGTALSGARSITFSSAGANATLLAGDPVGVAGQLLLTAYAGAAANGSGVITVPLTLPLTQDIASGQAVTWSAPTTTFQLATDTSAFAYGRAAWQAELELAFTQWAV